MSSSQSLRVSNLDIKNVKIGNKTKNKNGQGNYAPIFYNNKPLVFQANGLFNSFAGSSKKEIEKQPNELKRKYLLILDGEKSDCEFMPNKKGDGVDFYKFLCEFDNMMTDYLTPEKSVELGCATVVENKKEKTKSTLPANYINPVAEGTFKKDDKGNVTTEKYHNSIIMPLRLKKDEKGSEINEFTTKFFDARTKKEINVTPENIKEKIPYGTFVNMTLSASKLWLGTGSCKITFYINEMKMLFPSKNSTQKADDFDVPDETDFPSPVKDNTPPSPIKEKVETNSNGGNGVEDDIDAQLQKSLDEQSSSPIKEKKTKSKKK